MGFFQNPSKISSHSSDYNMMNFFPKTQINFQGYHLKMKSNLFAKTFLSCTNAEMKWLEKKTNALNHIRKIVSALFLSLLQIMFEEKIKTLSSFIQTFLPPSLVVTKTTIVNNCWLWFLREVKTLNLQSLHWNMSSSLQTRQNIIKMFKELC